MKIDGSFVGSSYVNSILINGAGAGADHSQNVPRYD